MYCYISLATEFYITYVNMANDFCWISSTIYLSQGTLHFGFHQELALDTSAKGTFACSAHSVLIWDPPIRLSELSVVRDHRLQMHVHVD